MLEEVEAWAWSPPGGPLVEGLRAVEPGTAIATFIPYYNHSLKNLGPRPRATAVNPNYRLILTHIAATTAAQFNQINPYLLLQGSVSPIGPDPECPSQCS